MRPVTSRAAAWLAALLLSACALTPAPTQPLPQLAGVPAGFEMSGRIAVRDGQRNEIARLRWTHARGRDLWVFASPLGNEVARIESGAQGATLAQAGAEPQQAASFAALTQALIGVALEPESLAAWLHGTPPPERAGEWQVTLEERQAAGAVTIARRLTATRGDVVVRLVVDDYRALEP